MQVILYFMCWVGYLLAAAAALALSTLLLLIPSERKLVPRLYGAIVGSIPGIIVAHVLVGIPLGSLLYLWVGVSDTSRSANFFLEVAGLLLISLTLLSMVVASLGGCYLGGCIGWRLAEGMPLRTAIGPRSSFREWLGYWMKRQLDEEI